MLGKQGKQKLAYQTIKEIRYEKLFQNVRLNITFLCLLKCINFLLCWTGKYPLGSTCREGAISASLIEALKPKH